MRYILSAAAVLAAVLLLAEPAVISTAVGAAVSGCLEVIVPSLFAFTVLAVYLQGSGLYRIALMPLTRPLSKLMRLDGELCAVFVLANIGGYPVGARLLSELVRQGRLSGRDAGRLLCCCYGSGPSFIVSVAGIRVFGSVAAGALLFVACFAASLIIGTAVCRCGSRIQLTSAEQRFDLSSGCFVSSVMAAARVMFTVCAMITGFSAVTALADITGITGLAEHISGKGVFPALLEISRVQELPSGGAYAFALCGALLSFGGVCVALQVAALTSGCVPLRGFLLSRVPAAALSAALAELLRRLCGVSLQGAERSQQVFAHQAQAQLFSVNAGMSVCVLVMCGMLLGMERQKR